jgi:outer membrane receptor protein involved in Fe transport
VRRIALFPFDTVVDAVTYPGFIPFASETQDSLDDLDQVTQEIRLASNGDGPLAWQAGVFYFDSDLQITTVGPSGFPPSTTVAHANTSWAVFGQAGYDVNARLTIAGGVRYTDDDKDFKAIAAAIPVAPVSVSDSQTSWDVSATVHATDDLNIYGRIASGFRAPTIQGRDVAFFSPPSVAQSETITSYEVGLKATLLNGAGRVRAALYHYEIEDQQFSAIGGAGNLTQLVNAEKGLGDGVEIEGDFQVTDRLTLRAGFAFNQTEIEDPNLRVATCGSGQCTPLDPIVAGFAVVNGNPFPQAPEYTLDLGMAYRRPMGDGGEFFFSADWTVKGEANIFLYDAVEYRIDPQGEGGLRLGYGRADGSWEAAVFARNITDEENVIGGIDFNNNTGFVNEPRIIGVQLSARM